MLTERKLAEILQNLVNTVADPKSDKSDDYKVGYCDAVADIANAVIDA